MSEQESQLAKALVKVQANLPAVHKGATGQIGGRHNYRYADLADITAAVLPVLAENGLAWMTTPTYDADGRFVLAYELLHVSGESRTGSYPLPSGKPQDIGSAITYGRRYTLCSVVGVVADEDDDGAAAQNARQEPQRARQRSVGESVADKARAELRKLCDQNGWPMSRVAAQFEKEYDQILKTTDDAALIEAFTASLVANAEHVLRDNG
jgi:hypothetical protein